MCILEYSLASDNTTSNKYTYYGTYNMSRQLVRRTG